ncbi:proteasome assembly chaperone family protein [uncultured Microbacterium sp.]|uniref:proteasome assembly chaperone family protein n=1 Tax=uncultured Microbacterium sp. TaxID=191216 RepID=UPI0026004102|nr:PAC2 family protein [uncultured Microbacterium sp.]
MPTSEPVYQVAPDAPDVPRGLPLVIALSGFTDAGAAASQVIGILRDEVPGRVVARFTNDVLLDYRARRPVVTFDGDHLRDYRPPRLELTLQRDEEGAAFLSLAGYEPDFAWDAFAAGVLALAHDLAVASVVWVHAIAMPVPHTRPIGTTVSGTRADLIEAHSIWRPTTEVPANAGHLLELRFAEADVPVAGFVLLVPHYLADAEYPATALAAIESIAIASGVSLPVGDRRDESREFLAKVDSQIEDNEELQRMLEGLESRHDEYMAAVPGTSAVLGEYEIPSADELAAELERFLAGRRDDDARGGL